MKIEEKYGVSIHSTTLSNYYKQNRITYTKVKKSLSCAKSVEVLQQMRLEFIHTLMGQLNGGKDVLYMDETTTNLWDLRSRVWQHKDKKIICKLPSSRGTSVTIFGALSADGNFSFKTGSTTNKHTMLEFLKKMEGEEPLRGKVMVLDNHKAHYSNIVKDYINEKGLSLLFLPPGTSIFNPIETVWAMVKRRWT